MSFEKADNFDYSTEKMDNESIQDKIDAKTLEISELTKESLQELKVDIQNSNSSLTLRDIDGNYLGKVRDNEVLIYEGETKTVNHNGEQKLFLKVRTKTGAIGFVSADYLKAKVNQDKIQIQEATNDSDINIVPDLKTNKPEDNKENRSTIKKVSNEVKKENDDIPKKTIVKNKTTDKDNKEKTSDNSKTGEILEIKDFTEEELSNSLILKISQIKEISQKTEDLETLGVIWDGEEKINANRNELNVIYSETLLILSKLQETNTPTAQTQVKKMYLFLAEYYSDNKENIENDHLRDYTLSTVNALGVIKDINGCPEFPNLTDIQNKYPQKEDFQRELELAMNAFDARFEDFADKNTNTDPDIIKAIELIEDNRGIGWFDFAEEVTDAIYDNVGGIGAMLAGTVAIVFASPGIIVGGAIAGGSALAGAGINAVVKGESSGREFAADAASLSLQVGAAGTIALKSSAVLAKTAGVWKTAGVLGVEAAADVTVVGVLGEYIHESIEGNEMQWSESFKDNLIWAPLVLLGGGKTVFRESLERAQLRKAMGDTDGVLQEAKIMNRELTNIKENFSGKSFTIDVDGNKYPIEISNAGELKLIDTQRVLDPNIKEDKKVIRAIALEIQNSNKKGNFSTKVETPKNQTEKVDLATTEKFTHKNNGKTYYRDSEGQFYNEKGHKSSVKEKNLNKVEEKKVKTKNEDANKSPKEQDEIIQNIDISKVIKKDLNTLTNGASVEYPNGLKVTKTLEGNYKIGDDLFYNINDASKHISNIIGKRSYELIINGGNKELLKRRNNLLNKDFGDKDNIFKLDNEGILRQKEKNGSYKKINLEELNSKQQDIIINEILGSKGYTTFNKSIEKLSSSNKKIGEIFNGDFWKKMKESNPKSIKSIEWIYNQSIGDYIKEIIRSGKADKYNKLFLARTLLTGKHSESFGISSWLPTKGKALTILGISGAEAATGNFSGDDYLGNYAEVVALGWLGTLILESPTLYDTGKAYIGFGDKAISAMEKN